MRRRPFVYYNNGVSPIHRQRAAAAEGKAAYGDVDANTQEVQQHHPRHVWREDWHDAAIGQQRRRRECPAAAHWHDMLQEILFQILLQQIPERRRRNRCGGQQRRCRRRSRCGEGAGKSVKGVYVESAGGGRVAAAVSVRVGGGEKSAAGGVGNRATGDAATNATTPAPLVGVGSILVNADDINNGLSDWGRSCLLCRLRMHRLRCCACGGGSGSGALRLPPRGLAGVEPHRAPLVSGHHRDDSVQNFTLQKRRVVRLSRALLLTLRELKRRERAAVGREEAAIISSGTHRPRSRR